MTPRPIREVLAVLPSGIDGIPLQDFELTDYLKKHCDRESDRCREKDHLLRDVLFCDGGVKEMEARVDQWFEHPQVRQRIKRMLPDTRFSNATKRIVSEMSTVYAEPAIRYVGGGDDNQARYRDLVENMSLDAENERVNQMYNLHRAVIVFPRVRIDGSIVLDIHSAATARAVMHPNDNTLVIGWLTRCEQRAMRGAYGNPPAWLLTTDFEREYFTKDFTPIAGTWEAHGLGISPAIAISSGSRAQPDFWPGDEGADLTAGHLTGWLIEALMIKETKTATRQPVFSGDATAMARNQALDSAGVIETPEGTSVTTVDIGTDINVFLQSADHALERVANNHGLALGDLKHQGVQSAEARELQLAPIRERRKKQVKRFRAYERDLARLLAILVSRYVPSMQFDPIEWSIDFGEPQVLLSKKERLEIFEIERRLGLDNTIDFYVRENPDLSDEQAAKELLRNVEVETWRNQAMRPLQEISGSMGATIPSTPPADGANQQPPPPDGVNQGPTNYA